MSPTAPVTIRWGRAQAAPVAPDEGLCWPDLDPEHNPAEWPELLRRLAAFDGPVLLLRNGIVLPETAAGQLHAAACSLGSGVIVGALDNLVATLSPLPPGATIPAPLDAAALARTCGWLGRGQLVDSKDIPLGAAVWMPGAAASLLAAGWPARDDPLPARVACRVLDRILAVDPARPLPSPPAWQRNTVPPPGSALDSLRARWPHSRDLRGDPLTGELQAPVPAAVPFPGQDALPVVLHICHGWGGGSARFIHDLARADGERIHLLLTSHGDTGRRRFGEWLELRSAASPELQLARFPLPAVISDTGNGNAGYLRILDEVRSCWQVDAVMVSSLIGHDLAALSTGLPTLVVGHDYYPLWPELHCDFGEPGRRFDRDDLERSLARRAPTLFGNRDADHWWQLREDFIAALLAQRPRMVTPTAQVRDNWLRMAPALSALDWNVVGHGLAPWPAAVATPSPRPAGRPLRVFVPGRIDGGKGLSLLDPLSRALPAGCELVLVGAGTAAAQLHGRNRVHILGDYARESLPALVAGLAPDLALLPATVAETFGYVLSELQSLRIPVLATAIGAYAERIADGRDGLLVEPDAGAIAARLAALAADRAPLDAVRAHLASHAPRDTAMMAADYRRLLAVPEVRSVSAPRTASEADPVATAAGALYRRALEAELAIAKLLATQAEQEAELARRADWGFGLERQNRTLATHLERERKEREALDHWIPELQREIAELQRDRQILQGRSDELERVHRSRSWQLMGPARRLVRALRSTRARAAFNLKRLANMLKRLRLSLSTRGFSGTLRHLWQRRRGAGTGPMALLPVVAPESRQPPARLPTSDTPAVSIIIPIHGKLPYTCACLAALAEHAGPTPFEVIVVDDASPDGSADVLACVAGLRLLRNERNLGFVGSCNAGAAAARGRWLVFLNNDAMVTAGWLEALLATFEQFDGTGLVGARLVYPDGRLQESGGLVFSDGSGWNYGRFADPADPRLAWARETDYCSGAAIVIERELFRRLGSFDERYAPAYYEDTDLAFKVREAGLKVVVQPTATVIHHEGITSGTDTAGSGMKRFQVVNQEKFLARWQDVLRRQPAAGTPVDALVRRRPNGCVLVIDATTPEPDQDSGSVRLTHTLRLLRESGRHVYFFADNRAYVPRYTERLQALGIEVLHGAWLGDPVTWLRDNGPALDAVLVCRHYIASHYLPLVRQYAPRARFIFDTVDLHYLREQRAAELTGSEELARQAAKTRQQELALIRASDVTLVVSPAEKALLATDAPGSRVDILSNVHPVHGCRRGFGDRADLLFVGGFQHPPNIDAITWFVREVFPAIHASRPDIRVHVIGSKMPPAVAALAGPGVCVHGHVADLEPYLDGCRIALAPLRYGAGVKGKLNMSMSYGQPAVATSIAVEGMHLESGKEVLVADDPAGFADAVLRLYGDEALWNRLSAEGLANVRRHFSFDTARDAIARIFDA